MSENLRKLVGVAIMAALVVVGVAVSSGDDTDFTRNTAFGVPKLGGGLNDQVRQPGDAEELASRAIAAAVKCETDRVLISTGDPIEPWRCGPLLIELTPRPNNCSWIRTCITPLLRWPPTSRAGQSGSGNACLPNEASRTG